jgi:hypothetical protein
VIYVPTIIIHDRTSFHLEKFLSDSMLNEELIYVVVAWTFCFLIEAACFVLY